MSGMRAAALARAVFVALILATFAAFFIAQDLKRVDPLVNQSTVGVVRFRPSGPGTRFAHFRVRTTVGGEIGVGIVSERTGRTVYVIPLRVHRYIHHPVEWRGQTASGAAAAPGRYRVTVHFDQGGQTVPLVHPILVLEGPPG
jgi:hypothetical protein